MTIEVDFVDVPGDFVWSIELTTKDEILVNDSWYRDDIMLVELSHQEPFKGRTKWSDLEMIHYQLLMFKAFDLLSPSVPMTTYSIEHKQPFLTFSFLASAIVKMSRINGITGFDRLAITRPRENRVLIDFRKTYRFDWDSYIPPKPEPIAPPTAKDNPFRLVVDNSK